MGRTAVTISWTVFMGVLLALATPARSQDCSLQFIVDPVASNFTLTANVTKPVELQLQPTNPGVQSGLQGSLVASIPGPCPTDAATLATALGSAQLSTTPATGPLQIYPTTITIQSGENPPMAILEWRDQALNTTLALSSAGTAAALGFTMTQGYVNSTSLLSPQGERVNSTGVNGATQTAASVTASGAGVTITVPSYEVVLPSLYVTTFGGTSLEGLANYKLSGALVARVALGCTTDCGANGRCAVAEDGTAGCECACGWSGPSCAVPSGFCPKFISETGAAAAVCPVLPPAPAPPPPSGGGASCGLSTCTAFQSWNSETASCDCREGWGGTAQCDACQTDAACSTFFSDKTGSPVNATCSTSRLYTSSTAFMSYACQLEGSGLDGVLEPGSFSVACNTTTGSVTGGATPGSAPSVSDGSYCRVDFALKDRANNPISCKASLCAFHANQSAVRCQAVNCACASACPDLDGVFKKIQGQPAVIDCDESGECVFDIKDFFVTLRAPCTNHACLVEGYVMEEGAYSDDPSDKDWTPLIAAIPLLALVAAAAVFTGYLLRHRAFFKAASMKTAATSSKGAGTAANGTAALNGVAHSSPDEAVRELAFTDVTSIVRGRRGHADRVILHSVSGVARGGELVGILGPSGGGKTSLLSVLAGSVEDRGASVSVRGAVTLDGRPLDGSQAHRVAYCAQDSTLLPTLTVEECVRYSALLRLPADTPASAVADVVSGVINELGLNAVAGSLVGGAGRIRGVSGGERRRVTIAMELVTNPAVLVLDEPTSGLDSYSALGAMQTLKALASSGRIVILSFHQPSPAMFSLLDRVFLLAKGRCVYAGPPSGVEPHFAGLGLPRPEGVGAAEHMLHCACDPESLPLLLGGVGAEGDDLKAPSVAGTDHTRRNSGGSGSEDTEAGRGGAFMENGAAMTPAVAPRRRAGVSRELAVLFWRASVDIIRNPTLLLLHWGMALIMGLFVGCIFFGVGLDISGAQDRLGGCFFALAFFAFTSLTTVDLVMAERRLVSREAGRGGYYSPASYLATKAVLDALLLRAIPVFLYSSTFYPMMGLVGGATHVALFLMVLATFAVTVGALSLAVAVGCSTPGQASLSMNIVLLVSLLVGGFFVNTGSMPDWISWLHYLSVFFYGYASLTINEISPLLLNFEVEGYAAVQNVRGTTFLEIIGIDPGQLTTYVIVLDCMYAAFLLLAFALLAWRMPRAQRLKPAPAPSGK